jgi:hypothetical protein
MEGGAGRTVQPACLAATAQSPTAAEGSGIVARTPLAHPDRSRGTMGVGSFATDEMRAYVVGCFSREAKPYSYLKASIGSNLAALIAGNIPLTMPTKLRIIADIIRVPASICR